MAHDRPVHVRNHIKKAVQKMGLDSEKRQALEHPATQQAPKPQNPEELCWCFAAGCLESRHIEGSIDRQLYERLHTHLITGTYPEAKDVRLAFPRPFTTIAAQSPVTMDTMRAYWRNHLAGEKTPVYLGIVRRVHTLDGQQFVRLWNGGSRLYHNHLRALLQPGSVVWAHGTIVTKTYLTP